LSNNIPFSDVNDGLSEFTSIDTRYTGLSNALLPILVTVSGIV